ncbi:MAG: DUF389 domain-containing protein [Prochlorococcus sp.]
MEPSRLEKLHHSYNKDAQFDEVFIVLTIGASLIASLGLLANNAAVVIGGMVVAPWIMPLRTTVFGVLIGALPLLIKSLRTLFAGVAITTLLSGVLGGLAALVGLDQFGTEVIARTSPNLLDLGIALSAGAIASYAKLRSDAVSSLAGTAIAVALVPPICVMGMLLSHQQWDSAAGAGLLFITNLLGILTGGLVIMGLKEPFFREKVLTSRLSLISFILTGILLVPLGISFRILLLRAGHETTRAEIQRTIKSFLENQTLTFGDNPEVEVNQVDINWQQNPPIIRVLVRVSNPDLPSYKQISAVQEEINNRQGLRFKLVVQRNAVVVVGPEEPPITESNEKFPLLNKPFPTLLDPPPPPFPEDEVIPGPAIQTSQDQGEAGQEAEPPQDATANSKQTSAAADPAEQVSDVESTTHESTTNGPPIPNPLE